ncbi:NAD-dependent epimerase/dehydratase family protein [Streptomyces sp. NBC_00249]|uniref:NAD-dependent epimerase/dehydratase family protein n=1 Tax=Streptomyces sp. NBC_00249 TaxID=2975690 RepID=UPI002253CC0C|nr:NAD-dependent epimerase/dehydratase family protein [Streptomyces sp. NBC_00249]MCX5196721.1 NAD-dependent epimerase/dehydratase family protein [Streptomyces sp. NBC_00249]
MALHVITGAGAIGTATARLLADAGEKVRVITRSGGGPRHPLVERVAADVTDAARITQLLEGAEVLYNAAAPAYQDWRTQFPPLAAALLTAAERTGVGYVMLGNLYGYGEVTGPLTPALPMRPTSDKGRVRAALWEEALAAHRAGRVRAAEVRGSDFLGAAAVGLFPLMAAPAVLAGAEAVLPVGLDRPHAWSYVDDVARTLIAVGARDDAWGRAWHVPSTSELSPRELMGRLARAAGAPAPRLRTMTPQELAEAVAGDAVMAEIPEMAYTYDRELLVDASDTERVLGVRATAIDHVLEEMLPQGDAADRAVRAAGA